MFKKTVFAGLLAFALQGLCLPGVASAADAGKGVQEILGDLKSKVSPGLVDGRRPDMVLAVAKGFGSADMDATDNGDPAISGRIQGIKYGVQFYGCTDHKECNNIQMFAFFDSKGLSPKQMNAWNAETRFGKAYIDKDGDVAIEMNVNLGFGVSKKNLEDTFEWWMLVLQQFQKFLDNPSAYSADKPARRSATSL